MRNASNANNPNDSAVRGSMTKSVLTAQANDSARQVAEMMVHQRVHHVPILDANSNLLGLVATSSVLQAWESEALDQPIRTFMFTDVASISPQASVRDAAQLMLSKKTSGVVVLENQRVVGVLTQEDILEAFVRSTQADPGDLKRVEALLYTSPIGELFNALSNAGI